MASPAPPSSSLPPIPPAVAAAAAPPVPELKYLAFFRAAVIKFYVFLVEFYNHLKEKAGSLKPGIESVERTVTTVVGPVVARVDFQPDVYLKFVDAKVDSTLQFVQEQTPEDWKAKAETVYQYLQKVPEKTKTVVEEYQQKGAVATAQSYYEYYLPLALAYLETLWNFIMTLPLVPQVLDITRPYALYTAHQYNVLLAEVKKSDLPVVTAVTKYLPVIPVEKLKKAE